MKNKKSNHSFLILVISALIGLTLTLITTHSDSEASIQKDIAKKIIRFHVIANSDSNEDQELKLKVKDAVVSYISPLLKKSGSIKESESVLIRESDNIKNISLNIIHDNGYSYDVEAIITDTYFPTKVYGEFSFPPGKYHAYEIKIGKAQGKNWWCVLYPPLCFVDVSLGVVDEDGKKMLSKTLTTEEYSAVSKDCKVAYRFKYLKFLNSLLED